MLRCDVCQLSVNSSMQMEQHIAGEKHNKRLRASGLPQSNVPAPKPNGPVGKPKTPHGGFINFVRGGGKSVDGGHDWGGQDRLEVELPAASACVPPHHRGPAQNSVLGNGALPCQRRCDAPPPSGVCAGPLGDVGLEGGGPVDRAVVDNAFGRLPTKRKPESLHCNVCHMSFNSTSQADAHFSGNKHAKRLRVVNPDAGEVTPHSKTQAAPVRLPQDGETVKGGLLVCSFCNVQVNSPPQMEAHRSGAKHKARVEQCRQMAYGSGTKSSQAPPVPSPATPSTAPLLSDHPHRCHDPPSWPPQGSLPLHACPSPALV